MQAELQAGKRARDSHCSQQFNGRWQWKLNNTLLIIICNGPTNALVCNKTLIQMSHTKTLKTTPTYFDHQGAF
jgi:hypothetical protein